MAFPLFPAGHTGITQAEPIQARMLAQVKAQVNEAKAFVQPAKEQRLYSARRARRLVGRIETLVDALLVVQKAGTRSTDEAISIVVTILQQTAEVLTFLKSTNAFAFYLQKANIASTFEDLNASIGRARQSVGLRAESGDLAKENRQDKNGDDDSLRLLIESIGGSRDALKTEIGAVSNADAQAILTALHRLREREPGRARGIGFEAVFLRNACSVITQHLGQNSSPLSPPNSSPLPSPYFAPAPAMPMASAQGNIPARMPTLTSSDPSTHQPAQPWFSPLRSGSIPIFSEPETMLPSLMPNIPAVHDWVLQATAMAQGFKSPVPTPERKGSGVDTTLVFYDPRSLKFRSWAPFKDWIFQDPGWVSRAEAVDKHPVTAGLRVAVVREWSPLGGALAKSIAARRIDKSSMQMLHPRMGDAVYVLAIFIIKQTTYVAGCSLSHADAEGNAQFGLIPLCCVSVTGRKPARLDPLTVALHEHAAPFQARLRISIDQAIPVEGTLNAYAIEFWLNLDGAQPARIHPLEHITNARKVTERREVKTSGGVQRFAFSTLEFRTRRAQGEEMTSLVFEDESALDELIADCKMAHPRVAW